MPVDAVSAVPLLLALAASLPAGWIVALFVRRETVTPIPLPAMVAAAAVVAIWSALVMPVNYLLAATLLLGWTLLILATIDLLALRLPDIFTLPLVAAGLLVSFLLPQPKPLAHLIGAAAGFFVLFAISICYRRLRGREGLGLGDAKLAAAAGAWLGWQALPSVVLIACAAAFVWIGVMVLFRGRAVLSRELAFGVPLCFAFWLVWLYGAPF
jgi:leader peptidase (prepilin peptidase)/N-methyltransferase